MQQEVILALSSRDDDQDCDDDHRPACSYEDASMYSVKFTILYGVRQEFYSSEHFPS